MYRLRYADGIRRWAGRLTVYLCYSRYPGCARIHSLEQLTVILRPREAYKAIINYIAEAPDIDSRFADPPHLTQTMPTYFVYEKDLVDPTPQIPSLEGKVVFVTGGEHMFCFPPYYGLFCANAQTCEWE